MSKLLREARVKTQHQHILYDPDLVPEPDPAMFNPEFWLQQQQAQQIGEGRGSAWFVGPGLQDWVLRHYRRGGLPGKLIKDHYFHTSIALSRPWREFRITARLFSQGVPVPRPVAACLNRHGLTDTGALITCRIPDAHSLGEHMQSGNLVPDDWQAVGRTIAHMHREQVWHADLNIANLLRDPSGQWTIIDLDRARLRDGQAWKAGNLGRLRRSVDKLLNQQPDIAFGENNWNALLVAYQDA